MHLRNMHPITKGQSPPHQHPPASSQSDGVFLALPKRSEPWSDRLLTSIVEGFAFSRGLTVHPLTDEGQQPSDRMATCH